MLEARIVPVVKDRQWLADNVRGLRDRGAEADFIYDDFNEELVVVYAEDTENRVRYLRVWAKRDGSWRAVLQMALPLPASP